MKQHPIGLFKLPFSREWYAISCFKDWGTVPGTELRVLLSQSPLPDGSSIHAYYISENQIFNDLNKNDTEKFALVNSSLYCVN